MIQKTKILICGITVVLALALAACPTGSGDSDNSSRLRLSGKVYTQDFDIKTLSVTYNNYNENLEISDGVLGGVGKIRNGQLNYTIGEPPLSPIGEGLASLKEMYPGLEFSSEDVNAAVVILEIVGSEEYSYISKTAFNITPSIFPPAIKLTIETVNYVYLDKDIKITAEGNYFEYNDFDFPISLTTENINLSLKKGWNPLYSKISVQINVPRELLSSLDLSSLDLSTLNLADLRPTGNLSMSVADPDSLKWALETSQPSDFLQLQ